MKKLKIICLLFFGIVLLSCGGSEDEVVNYPSTLVGTKWHHVYEGGTENEYWTFININEIYKEFYSSNSNTPTKGYDKYEYSNGSGIAENGNYEIWSFKINGDFLTVFEIKNLDDNTIHPTLLRFNKIN